VLQFEELGFKGLR